MQYQKPHGKHETTSIGNLEESEQKGSLALEPTSPVSRWNGLVSDD